jgi:NADPH:quinone reductase
MADETIFITGVSSGLGLALAEEALTQGWRVVGTVRSEKARAGFEAKAPGLTIGRVLDVTDSAHIPEVIAEVEDSVGAIDVLVNNAGYGMEGPVEEVSLAEIRRQFEVNVFGAVAVTQAVLPFMRKRRSGRILNITSMGGLVTFPGQIFKILGCRVIGMTSSQSKRDVLTQQLGFDAALDYRASDFSKQLAALAPTGPTIYFDNVGGQVSHTIMNQMRRPARIVECGQISTYDDPNGAWMVDIKPIHRNGLRFEGFTPLHFREQWMSAIHQLVEWVNSGQLLPLETELHGLESLSDALAGIFRGNNVGKMVVAIQ